VIDPKILDNLASRLAAALPPGIKEIKHDGTFAKLNLVTREEFDVQAAVLSRTHAKVKELEEQIMRLETRLHASGTGNGGDATQQSRGF
jgi:BMFP domain-containing protein YqiC